MTYEVDIVRVPEQALLVLRMSGPRGERRDDEARLRELAAQAGLSPAGPVAARLPAPGRSDAAGAAELCLPVVPRADGSVPDRVGEARGELVPAHPALRAVHEGVAGDTGDAWRAVDEARAALGYTASGPAIEVYVRDAGDASLTEVLLPYAN